MISREQGASTISRRCIYVAPSNSGDRLGPAFVGTRNPPLGRRLQWRGTKAVTSQQTGQCHTAFLFWWRQRRSQYGAIQSGAASFSIWPCDEDERSPRWRWPGDWPSLVCNRTSSYRLGSLLPFAGEFEIAIMIEVGPKRCMGRTDIRTCN